MHRAIQKHKARMEFDNWLFDAANQAVRTEKAIRAFHDAMVKFQEGIAEAFRKAHEKLLASGHKPQYLGQTLLPERYPH
jgi:hypothetical protein